MRVDGVLVNHDHTSDDFSDSFSDENEIDDEGFCLDDHLDPSPPTKKRRIKGDDNFT